MRTHPRTFALALAVAVGIPALAQARVPLSEQPAVRHKLELRKFRLELSPTFDMSVAADYITVLSGGLKAEFHLSDSWSFGAMAFFGQSSDSGLGAQIYGSLEGEIGSGADPTPSQDQYRTHVNKLPIHGALHGTFTPWYGKMAFFGKLNVDFDVYFQGGLAFAQTTNTFDGPCMTSMDDDPRNDCPHNAGFNPGILLGAGIHLFFSQWMALDIAFHDYFFADNPSGFDFTGDRNVDNDDRRFLGHLFFGVGLSMYLPGKADRSP